MRKTYLSLLVPLALLPLFLSVPVLPASSQEPEFQIYLPSVIRDYDTGWQWLEPSQIALIPKPYNTPLAVIDQVGKLHLFWDTLSSPRLIYHAYLGDNGWSQPTSVAQTLGTSYTLHTPIVDLNGRIHFVWRNWLGTGIENPYRLIYTYYEDNTWSKEEEITRTSEGMTAMAQMDEQGNIHVTYAGGLISTHTYHTTRTSSGWTLPSEVKPSHTIFQIWPDRYGGIHFYGSDAPSSFSYSYWKEGQFIVSNLKGAGKLSGRQTQQDGLNHLHVFWLGQVPVAGGQVNGVYYQCMAPDLTFTPQQVLSGENSITGSIIKASDNNSKVALSWKEYKSNKVQLMIKYGCGRHSMNIMPFPEGINWDLKSLALSNSPGKVCGIARKLYTNDYTAVCANIER